MWIVGANLAVDPLDIAKHDLLAGVLLTVMRLLLFQFHEEEKRTRPVPATAPIRRR